MYHTNAGQHGATCRNSSWSAKLKVRLLQHLCVLQEQYNVTSTRHQSCVARKKLLTYLVFQLVVRHHLNACDISTSACDKARLTRM